MSPVATVLPFNQDRHDGCRLDDNGSVPPESFDPSKQPRFTISRHADPAVTRECDDELPDGFGLGRSPLEQQTE